MIIQESVDGNARPDLPSVCPLSGWEGISILFFSLLLFFFLIQRTPAGGHLALGRTPERCRFLGGSPVRFASPRSAISLATRSTPAAQSHTAPRGCSSLFIGSQAWMKISRELRWGLYRNKKLMGPARGSGLVLYLKALPFAACSTFAMKHIHSDT